MELSSLWITGGTDLYLGCPALFTVGQKLAFQVQNSPRNFILSPDILAPCLTNAVTTTTLWVGWRVLGKTGAQRLTGRMQNATRLPHLRFFTWARLTGLARFPRSRLATLFFTKISMCSYEKAGWPGYRDLGFFDRDLGNRAGNFSNFSHMNTPARIPGRNIFNCAWLVRSLTGRNAVPRVFWWPFGHFLSR